MPVYSVTLEDLSLELEKEVPWLTDLWFENVFDPDTVSYGADSVGPDQTAVDQGLPCLPCKLIADLTLW